MGSLRAEYQEFNSQANGIVDRRFYMDFQIFPHLHGNTEIVYVAGGMLNIVIDGESYSVGEGQYAIVLPWQIHAYSTPEHSHSVIIVFPGKYIASFSANMDAFHGEPQVFEAAPPVHELFIRYVWENGNLDEYMLSCILYGLCHSFVSTCRIVPNADRNQNQAIIKMMDYISNHFKENLTLKDVASALGYNYYYLSHLFCEYSGMTFQQFRNMKRIEYARRELIVTKKPITTIALECGFSCVRTFNRIFRSIVNMTPMQYRIESTYAVGDNVRLKALDYQEYPPSSIQYIDVNSKSQAL